MESGSWPELISQTQRANYVELIAVGKLTMSLVLTQKKILQKSAFSYCSTSRLALGSPGCLVGCHHARNTLKTLIMLYFWKAKGPRTSKMIFWTVKYTNTACDEVSEIPNMCYIFEKPRVQGHKIFMIKMIFWTVNYTNTNAQIHKYKFRKTQMHK